MCLASVRFTASVGLCWSSILWGRDHRVGRATRLSLLGPSGVRYFRILAATKDMQATPHRYELRGEIDPADLGKFISPLLASPGDHIVLMASRARHIAAVLEASLRCKKVEMVFTGPAEGTETDDFKRPETVWASLRVRAGEKPVVDPTRVTKLRVSAETASPNLGEKIIHQLERGDVVRLEAMGPVALARMVNGIAVAARRGEEDLLAEFRAERNSGSLISRARGMRPEGSRWVGSSGRSRWRLASAIRIAAKFLKKVGPMVEAEAAKPEIVSSESN
ncbi:hypothetical protein FOZ60_000191 [Perkinsus olseni]|uniref:Lysophosphatidylcholine acyltransferase 2 n=1 Tax=Perkinsus olseni TaxID=32597 RepID=A0A7J6PK52_PEROL|nr:hypothetical protein FOZ60_000191 [Perkinsus olseni]